MILHPLRGRWWPIVCPPSGTLRNGQKECTGEVRYLMLALNYT